MRRIEEILVSCCRWLIGIAFAALIVAVLMQVVGRLSGDSPIWTEEMTRFALLYVASIGAGLSFRSGDLVNVDVFCEAFGEVWSKRFRLLSAVLTAVMCAVLFAPTWQYVEIGQLQTSPAMELPMHFAHFSIMALLLLLFVFSLLRAVSIALLGQDGRPMELE
ncbi:TRAP transporter small permease subunit [Vibrio sp. SCSIO 43132]|uniref:TRAP transporter small permease n=1 Tax=Vibrio sp. SCSIO 43132 TaxID=2779363 RepID=UPI001CA80460|nr:TRAP transporter small permease subunit [Vibrio sp. SCSIO 43132]UAB73236.1 TRAP transporter small permease subunit [Vibrio sp. SCSIO 43132]